MHSFYKKKLVAIKTTITEISYFSESFNNISSTSLSSNLALKQTVWLLVKDIYASREKTNID